MMLRRSLMILAALCGAASLYAGTVVAAETRPAQTAAADKAAALPDPVARVNGVALPAAELQKALAAFSKSPAAAQVPAGQEKAVQQFLLNQLIGAELMYQAAKNTPVADIDKKMDEAIARLKGRFPSDDAYKKGLQEQGMSEKELKELVRRNLLIENYVEQVIVPKQQVSAADAQAFYDKNPEAVTKPEQVRASHILITVDAKASEGERKKAKEKIESLLQQVKKGADFAKLAQENSGCPSSKQGGDLGYFGKGQMVKPFEEAAWSLKPGEVSGVVETQFGYHIIRLTEKQPSSKIPFAEIKERIIESLKRQKVTEAVKATLDEAKQKGKIEVYLK